MAILNTNISECNARLIGISGQPQDAGFVIKRCWPWLQGSGLKSNDTHVNTLYATLSVNQKTVNNPKANNDSYAGLFVASMLISKDENEDGTESRSSSIIQTLTRVKTVTTEASLGTPDVGADKETLNYLGFQEGTAEHCYYKYRNLNPANAVAAMTVSIAVPTGYSALVKRKWDVETDKTGTLFVVFEKDTWTADNWIADRKAVSYINYDTRSNKLTGNAGIKGAKGYEEQYQLTGIPKGNVDSLVTRSQKGDTNRVVQAVTLIERGNGEYKITQRQGISFASTGDSNAFTVGAKGSMNGAQSPGLTRVWPRRTYAAMITLTTSTGKAVNNYSTYIHDSFHVEDHGDGTFTVTQVLGADDGSGTTGATYFAEKKNRIVKPFVRTKDNFKKYVVCQKYTRAFSSENAALEYIEGLDDAHYSSKGAFVVKGSDRVTKKNKFYYIAQAVLGSNDTLASTWETTQSAIGVANWRS